MIRLFTIVTPSHLSQARALMSSLMAAAGQDASTIELTLFVLGAREGYTHTDLSGVSVRRVEDLVSPEYLRRLSIRYTPAETCWALKPVLLRNLLLGSEVVYYFDSDIYFFGALPALHQEMAGADILLTPHYLQPFPVDRKTPSELTLLRGGVFNAGFIGVRSGQPGSSFLLWWEERVRRFGRNDPDNGMCGDQRWLDLAPVLFDGVKICRHPGFNVAYWNLHERALTQSSDGWRCGEDEVVFFHFSGFDPSSPQNLSHHQNRNIVDRELGALLEFYAACLKGAGVCEPLDGYYRYKRWWHAHVKYYRFVKDIFRNPRRAQDV